MEFTIIRKIDALGRIVLPKDIRTALNLREGSFIEINVKNGSVLLTKANGGEKR